MNAQKVLASREKQSYDFSQGFLRPKKAASGNSWRLFVFSRMAITAGTRNPVICLPVAGHQK